MKKQHNISEAIPLLLRRRCSYVTLSITLLCLSLHFLQHLTQTKQTIYRARLNVWSETECTRFSSNYPSKGHCQHKCKTK